MAQYEYQVCQIQQSRVTFVNNLWIGQVPYSHPDSQEALNSCPQVWDFLNQAGVEGWELVAATTRTQDEGDIVDVLYLKR